MNVDHLFEQKGIVGNGLSLNEKNMRLARLRQEGPLFKVIQLKEVLLPSPDKKAIQQALFSFALDKKVPLAVNVKEEALCAKKLFIPPMGKSELAEALRWQLMEETQNSQKTFEIRFEQLPGENEEGLQEFMVYGLEQLQIEGLRNHYTELELNVVAAEPLAVTLSSLLEILEPDSLKMRGIFYKDEKKALFAGVKAKQLYFWKSIFGAPGENSEPRGDFMIDFQQAADEFLLQEKLTMLEEGILAGEWQEEEKEKISASFGITFSRMEDKESPLLIFEKEEMKKDFSRFIPEIGLALFPKGLT